MKTEHTNMGRPLVAEVRRVLVDVYAPRIICCLRMLSNEEIWWRPNRPSNSVGNMVLHLQGNVRQWIISGLGGEADIRERDREFEETCPVSRSVLVRGLRKTVTEADQVLTKIRSCDLTRGFSIQGYNITGLQVLCHVSEHFALHAGQIIYVTKLKLGKDLKFTRLPSQPKGRSTK